MRSKARNLFLERVSVAGRALQNTLGRLEVGEQIRIIRTQLGMSQTILAKRSGVPQSTISRIEQGGRNHSHAIIEKIAQSLYCDLSVALILQDSIDSLRLKQASAKAKKKLNYVRGTMNLEEQEPDLRHLQEMEKQEVEDLLRSPKSQLWEE